MGKQKQRPSVPVDPVRARTSRSIALALVLVGFAVLLYAMTVVKLL
ncbi:hypothetical protein NFI95_05020 [Acetobacteraceae bacterium KSS8]|uniref:Uncharacterized protein n=1 Tax=Endosaccharibacter trunci TaxID=2812733 RepID=A0ABT1W4J7_9PROT|nr:hypothetical protein [Acetobacteraceae bacterium KSS8]